MTRRFAWDIGKDDVSGPAARHIDLEDVTEVCMLFARTPNSDFEQREELA